MLDEFRINVTVTELLTGKALENVTVKACTRAGWSNPDCTTALADEQTTDGLGKALLVVRPSAIGLKLPWDGFYSLSAPSIYPEIDYIPVPLASNATHRFAVLEQSSFEAIGMRYGVQALPGHGHVSISVFDCLGLPAAGVSLELEPPSTATRRFYSTGFVELTETRGETSADGLALFTNVPPGLVRAHAILTASGERIASPEFVVRAGTRSVVFVEPDS